MLTIDIGEWGGVCWLQLGVTKVYHFCKRVQTSIWIPAEIFFYLILIYASPLTQPCILVKSNE